MINYIPDSKGEMLDEYNAIAQSNNMDLLYPELNYCRGEVNRFIHFCLIFALDEGMRL